jgi:hypothetical protein
MQIEQIEIRSKSVFLVIRCYLYLSTRPQEENSLAKKRSEENESTKEASSTRDDR